MLKLMSLVWVSTLTHTKVLHWSSSLVFFFYFLWAQEKRFSPTFCTLHSEILRLHKKKQSKNKCCFLQKEWKKLGRRMRRKTALSFFFFYYSQAYKKKSPNSIRCWHVAEWKSFEACHLIFSTCIGWKCHTDQSSADSKPWW